MRAASFTLLVVLVAIAASLIITNYEFSEESTSTHSTSDASENKSEVSGENVTVSESEASKKENGMETEGKTKSEVSEDGTDIKGSEVEGGEAGEFLAAATEGEQTTESRTTEAGKTFSLAEHAVLAEKYVHNRYLDSSLRYSTLARVAFALLLLGLVAVVAYFFGPTIYNWWYTEADFLGVETGTYAFSARGNATASYGSQVSDLIEVALLTAPIFAGIQFLTQPLAAVSNRVQFNGTVSMFGKSVSFMGMFQFALLVACFAVLLKMNPNSREGRAFSAADLAVQIVGMAWCLQMRFYPNLFRNKTTETESKLGLFAAYVFALAFIVTAVVLVYFLPYNSVSADGTVVGVETVAGFDSELFSKIVLGGVTAVALIMYCVDYESERYQFRQERHDRASTMRTSTAMDLDTLEDMKNNANLYFSPLWTIFKALVLLVLTTVALIAYEWWAIKGEENVTLSKIWVESKPADLLYKLSAIPMFYLILTKKHVMYTRNTEATA